MGKYEHQLRREVHGIAKKLWPWDEALGRKLMYKFLKDATGKNHIADMDLNQLKNAKTALLKRRKLHKFPS